MSPKITLFPVGNGDMTLVRTESGRRILVDINIRAAADDPDDDTPDAAQLLRDRLERDSEGRWYVDVLLVSHPDRDHCTGLRQHFHMGPPGEWSATADKILIRELWSSPMVFRRASRRNVLCDDARAFNAEARRRVRRYRDDGQAVKDGNRILILGEDEDGRTDDLDAILVLVDEAFSRVNGKEDASMTARLLGPMPSDDGDDDETLSKNNSSTILRFALAGAGIPDKCRLLTGGDAQVAIWERLWQRYRWRADWLSYDILQAPHHCSWHSLSYDSWSEQGEDAEVCQAARDALAQTRGGATIVASSNPIKDDDSDPPCIRAKREYETIASGVAGSFVCVGEEPSDSSPGVLEFEVGSNGVRRCTSFLDRSTVRGPGTISRHPHGHG